MDHICAIEPDTRIWIAKFAKVEYCPKPFMLSAAMPTAAVVGPSII